MSAAKTIAAVGLARAIIDAWSRWKERRHERWKIRKEREARERELERIRENES